MRSITNVNNDDNLRFRRNKLFDNIVDDYFKQNNNKSNILSSRKIYDDCFGWKSLIKKCIWQKHFLKNNKIIFGLKSGIAFTKDFIFFINGDDDFDYWLIGIRQFPINLEFKENLIIHVVEHDRKKEVKVSNNEDILVLRDFINFLNKINEDFYLEITSEEKNQEIQISKIKSNLFDELDKNNDGKVDLTDNDFNKLITKNQKQIMDIDKQYIHQFVKVSNYIKTKNQNIQNIFEVIKNTHNENELEERINLLKNQIYTYDLIVFHSINMVCSLTNDDLISFYEIYESFDKLGIYNSNWENEISQKLINIEDKLDDLMYSIDQMESSIVNSITNLSYITQNSFVELNHSVVKQLKEIESSINFNNLLNGIQTYQLYKINKNTKSLIKK